VLRDRTVSLLHQLDRCMDATSSDTRQRARGIAASARSMFDREGMPTDRALTARVRSKLGRYCSHPHAVHVWARGGRVTLSGNILANEVDDLLCAVSKAPGVEEVEDRLTPLDEAGNNPDLQGGCEPSGEPCEFAQSNWSPSARLLAGTIGTALIGAGLTQRFPTACVLGTIGCALLARSASNRGLTSLVGLAKEAMHSEAPEQRQRHQVQPDLRRAQALETMPVGV